MLGERVVCFRKDLLERFHLTEKVFYAEKLKKCILGNLEVIPRERAEKDYEFKQLVVYAVITSGGLFLSYKRTEKTTESRLRNKYSIGIGGHINTVDKDQLTLFDSGSGENFLVEALFRELGEEIKIKSQIIGQPEIFCFINDDSTDVGRVHFGTCWLIKLEEPHILTRKETGIGEVQFSTLSDLKNRKVKFEGWSKLLIDYLCTKSLRKLS